MPDVDLVARARATLLALLPRGRAFLVHQGTPITKLVEVIAREIARSQERIDDLRGEALPSKSVELLSDWESDLGLPDLTLPLPTTLAGRQAQVAAKLLDSSGHTEADIRAVALALGYSHVGITHYYGAECGVAECGVSALTNDYFSHVVLFSLHEGPADAAVEAAIMRLRRAHSDFWFEFTPAPQTLLIDGEPLLIDGEELLV